MSPRKPPSQSGLFPADRWAKRRHELNADKVLRKMKADSVWDDRHDLAASALRAAARAVDAAELMLETEPSPYAAQILAQCTRELRETVQLWGIGLGGSGNDDAFDAFLAALASGDLQTGFGDPPPGHPPPA